MQLHQLKPIHKAKARKRVGRGGSHGVYCGRGMNGQRSRASRKFKPVVRELIKKYAKLRGYKFNPRKERLTILNLEIIAKNFGKGDKISPQTLTDKRIIRKINGMVPRVKILAAGDIKVSLIFEGCSFSQAAKKKIEAAGGEIR